MIRCLASGCLKTMFILVSASVAFGQSSPLSPTPTAGSARPVAEPASQTQASDEGSVPENPAPAASSENKVLNLPRQIWRDQIGMWTSPARIRLSDATWLVPAGGFTAALFATDSDVSGHLSNTPNTLLRYRHISDYGVYSMAGGSGAIYLLGLATQNAHQRETGFLSGESAIDALAVVEALKYATGRARPFQDNGKGQFLHSGTSFPSEHSAAAWAIAGTFAHEYPSPFMKFQAHQRKPAF